MTAQEFQALLKKGVISGNKRLRIAEITPEYQAHLEKENEIFIPGEVYSSKNSKRIFPRGVKKGQSSLWTFKGKPINPFITDSAAVEYYKKKKIGIYLDARTKFLRMSENKPFPLHVGFCFHRKCDARWDFNNMTELVQVMMVAARWIEDDDVHFMVPVYIPYKIDKLNPGVTITIL